MFFYFRIEKLRDCPTNRLVGKRHFRRERILKEEIVKINKILKLHLINKH